MRTPNEKLKKKLYYWIKCIHRRIDTRKVSVQITINNCDDKMAKPQEELYKKYQK
jgi:hypothetical protein